MYKTNSIFIISNIFCSEKQSIRSLSVDACVNIFLFILDMKIHGSILIIILHYHYSYNTLSNWFLTTTCLGNKTSYFSDIVIFKNHIQPFWRHRALSCKSFRSFKEKSRENQTSYIHAWWRKGFISIESNLIKNSQLLEVRFNVILQPMFY